MCGRFVLDATADLVARQFEVEINKSFSPRYNIAPTQHILSIRQNEATKRVADVMQWGLVPNWVKDLDSWKSNLINARAETITEKPSFKGAFKYRPCLIPVSGFYEWTKDKQPYHFQLQNNHLFSLAGLWESWQDELFSCTILTTKANLQAAKVHHRMPVIIPSQQYHQWLGKLDEREQLLANLPRVDLQLYPVSKIVNTPKNDFPDCVAPIA